MCGSVFLCLGGQAGCCCEVIFVASRLDTAALNIVHRYGKLSNFKRTNFLFNTSGSSLHELCTRRRNNDITETSSTMTFTPYLG